MNVCSMLKSYRLFLVYSLVGGQEQGEVLETVKLRHKVAFLQEV